VFDTVTKLGWSVDVRKHVIKEVVHNILEGDVWWGEDDEVDRVDEIEGYLEAPGPFGWDKSGKKRKKGDDEKRKKKRPAGQRNVPKAITEDDCVDCFKWEFGSFKDESDWTVPT